MPRWHGRIRFLFLCCSESSVLTFESTWMRKSQSAQEIWTCWSTHWTKNPVAPANIWLLLSMWMCIIYINSCVSDSALVTVLISSSSDQLCWKHSIRVNMFIITLFRAQCCDVCLSEGRWLVNVFKSICSSSTWALFRCRWVSKVTVIIALNLIHRRKDEPIWTKAPEQLWLNCFACYLQYVSPYILFLLNT